MAKRTSKKSSKSTHRGDSFKRTYHEDYLRDLEVPSFSYHIFYSFKLFFQNWKLFLPLLLIMSLVTIGLLGFVNDSFYQDVSGSIVVILVALIIWLTTIFILRHRLAGKKVTLRDAFYNALTPLLSSLVVLVIALIQCLPIVILIISYSAAIETHFLDLPFYALLFLGFAALMILLSIYLLSSTILALVAVSAPGLYPLETLKTVNSLIRGRRIRFILRIIVVLVVLAILWGIIIWPIAFFTSFSIVTSIFITILACFSVIYVATYFYLYYRWMLDFDNKK